MLWVVGLLACLPAHVVEPTPPAESSPPTYAGTATCAACHPAAAVIWAGTRHATAHATLTAALHGSDPECLACHVTAKGAVDDVGCEACHGPGSAHAAAPRAGYGRLPKRASACVVCHTRDNSPDFVWSGYWRQIKHGR